MSLLEDIPYAPEDLDIYITNSHDRQDRGAELDIELEERAGLLPVSELDAGDAVPGLGFREGRPDWRSVVGEVFERSREGGKVAVLVCGPRGMGRAVRGEGWIIGLGRGFGASLGVFRWGKMMCVCQNLESHDLLALG